MVANQRVFIDIFFEIVTKNLRLATNMIIYAFSRHKLQLTVGIGKFSPSDG